MGLWHVYYENWQMECCGSPFSVGDEVSWPLLLCDADDVLGGGWYDQLSKVSGPVEGGTVPVLRDENGLVVAVGAGEIEGAAEWVRLVGLLTVEGHSDGPPEVRGRVRAVQLVTQEYAPLAPGSLTWVPVPGERRLRSVESCPKWFGERDAGVMVTLEVPDTDSWLSHAVREASGLPEDAPPGAETEGIDGASLAALLETFSTARRPPC
jgi:hypothetical protein